METELCKVMDRDGHLASACAALCLLGFWDPISLISDRNRTTFCLFSIGFQFPADRTRLSAHFDARRHSRDDCSVSLRDQNPESQIAIMDLEIEFWILF